VRTKIVGNRSFGSANFTASGVGGDYNVPELSDCYVNDNKGTANIPAQAYEILGG